MRDPARIDRMIEKLRALWHAHPDQRIGQLVVNLTRGGEPYVFHTEDSSYERAIDHATSSGSFNFEKTW